MKRNSTKKSVKAVAAAAGVAAVMLLPGCSTAAGGTGAPVVGGGGSASAFRSCLHLTNGGRRPAGNFGSWWAAFGVQLIGPAEEFSRRYA